MELRYILKSTELKRRRVESGIAVERMAKVLDIPEIMIKTYEDSEPNGACVTYERVEEMSWFLHCEVSDIAYERG